MLSADLNWATLKSRTSFQIILGWLGGMMVLGNLGNFWCKGIILMRIIVGQGLAVLAAGVEWGCRDFLLSSVQASVSVSLSLSGRGLDID